MKKIAFIQKTSQYSGAENVVLTIMKLLPKDKYECVYISPIGEIQKFVESENQIFIGMPDASIKSVKKAILSYKPDILHTTDFGMSSYVAALRLNIPIVAHLHCNTNWLKNPFHPKNIAFSLALPNIANVISVSKSIEDDFFYKPLLKKKNIVINNVLDYSPQETKCFNDEIKNYDVLFLGRLTSYKNPIFFCKLIKRLKSNYPNISAKMVGDGDLRSEVEKYIKNNNLENNIVLEGFRQNRYDYINKCRLMVMPSINEGFGLAAVESLACGKPVLCSGAGGLKEVIDDGCGAICKSEEEYVEEIKNLFENEEYYNKKKEQAKITAKKFSDTENYINRIMMIYDKCTQK